MVKPSFATMPAFDQAASAFGTGKFVEAERICQKIIAAEPEAFDAVYLLAECYLNMGKYDEALAGFDRAIELRPNSALALNDRGVILRKLGRYEEAVATYDRAIALQPDYALAFNNRGNSLERLGRFEEAVASFDSALALSPDYAISHYNRGLALHGLRRWGEAIASHERAVVLRREFAEAHFDQALTSLLIGDFDRGWKEYEWRWEVELLGNKKPDFHQRQWSGQETIEGKSILLYAEQGFGDTIQFCRYLPLVAARGAQVILEAQNSLTELMGGLSGSTQVVAKGSILPDFDICCPLLSLPLAFGTRLETIPRTMAYLQAPSPALTKWLGRIGSKGYPRIGLAWRGEPKHKNDHNRSIGFKSLVPLLDANATFVSLQKELRAEDAAVLDNCDEILQFGNALETFSDTAALISQLDLVISVDTSIAHLAGALGKPVWVLLPYIPDWRWLLNRDDSPWYPTARLFRQNTRGIWDDVITSVRAALNEFISATFLVRDLRLRAVQKYYCKCRSVPSIKIVILLQGKKSCLWAFHNWLRSFKKIILSILP